MSGYFDHRRAAALDSPAVSPSWLADTDVCDPFSSPNDALRSRSVDEALEEDFDQLRLGEKTTGAVPACPTDKGIPAIAEGGCPIS